MTRFLFTIWLVGCAAVTWTAWADATSAPTVVGSEVSTRIIGGVDCAYCQANFFCDGCYSSATHDVLCDSEGNNYVCQGYSVGPRLACFISNENDCGGDRFNFDLNSSCQTGKTPFGDCTRKKNQCVTVSESGDCP